MLYKYSYFGEKQNPCDVYGVYLLIEGQHLFIDIELDAITGETQFDGIGRSKLTHLPCGEVRTDWLFKRLEARQKAGLPASQDTEFPMAVRALERCPKTGLWWEQDNSAEDARRFTQGDRMPDLPTSWDSVWYRLQE